MLQIRSAGCVRRATSSTAKHHAIASRPEPPRRCHTRLAAAWDAISCRRPRAVVTHAQPQAPGPGSAKPPVAGVGSLKDNIAKLAVGVDALAAVRVQRSGREDWVVPNAEGKRASLAIYAHLAAKHGGKLTPAAATEGIQLYGQYVQEAADVPGSHPNIDLLFEVVEQGLTLDMITDPVS